MKVRSGFVSNSSSSSFILITSVENHKKALEQLTGYERAIANVMVKEREEELFGTKVVVAEEYSGEWSSIYEGVELDEKWLKHERSEEGGTEYPEIRSEAWHEYKRIIEKLPETEMFCLTIYDS